MSWFTTAEKDVITFIQKAEQGFKVVEKDAKAAITWIAKEIPVVANDVAMVAGFIGQVPVVGTNPEVLAAISAANIAMQGLNVLAQAYNSTGVITAQSVASAYAAYKNATAAKNAAMAIAVSNTVLAKPAA
jgi:hypothetical protein